MKEIWEKFKEACKDAWGNMVDGVKEVCRTTWKLFKETCINFITGIFSWIKDLVCGIVEVLIGFLKLIFAALFAFLEAAFDLIYNKIIKWIIKW